MWKSAPSIPRTEAMEQAKGALKGVHALRLGPGEDILRGIEQFCAQQDIRNGFILSALGSWRRAEFCDLEWLPDGRASYGAHKIVEDCVELVNLSGMICHNASGEIQPHIHLTLCDQAGAAFGGHMCYGCEVLITTDILIGELTGLVMGRRFDEAMGVPLFEPRETEYGGL